jgi:bacteriocin biosynthesis cyclodehydratase domain-containing protein
LPAGAVSVGPGWKAALMRPALKSGLLPVWRDRDTLQIGIDPRRAIALSGMSQAAFLIGLLDGSRDREQIIAAAAGSGIPAVAAERILTLLAAGGALDDFPASTLRELPASQRARLAPELATAALAHGDGDGGARALVRRRGSVVGIEGDHRIGRDVARILSASGVGAVRLSGAGTTAAAAAAAPASPDLLIVIGRPARELSEQLARQAVPHLAATAGEAIGVVGPLVLPGKTACLRCLDYFRAGNDPAWPLILAQIAGRSPEPPACDAVLAAAVAAQTAAQALTAIDKAPAASAAANGTLELVLPDWRWRRRTWLPHPACPCTGRAAVPATPLDNRH